MGVIRPSLRARRIVLRVLFGFFRVEWTAAVCALALVPLPILSETFYFARIPPGPPPFAILGVTLGVTGGLAYAAAKLPLTIPRSWAAPGGAPVLPPAESGGGAPAPRPRPRTVP
ncbi:MAG: hypothetical protein L3K15_04430 [Thermoplasmata archaeon]|nr:hypothetical protein [Thermoplasmata archaeon]